MSLKTKYKTLYIVTQQAIDPFTGIGGGDAKTSFKGVIQHSNGSNTYINGKDSSFIGAILFTSISTRLKEKDLIEDTDGTRYIVAIGGQSNGITGIAPQRGQHSEYSLTYANKGL